jgi:hypothetical protein
MLCPAKMLGNAPPIQHQSNFNLRFSLKSRPVNARKSAPYADIIAFNHTDSLFEFVVFRRNLQTV